MLFIQSNSLALSPSLGGRLRLLDALAERGFAPLLRTARRGLFRSLVGQAVEESRASGAASELERECAARGESRVGGGAYSPGDLFCDGDCVLALVFGGGEGGALTASVIYDLDTAAPLGRLERFCREVRAALGALEEDENAAVGMSSDPPAPSSDDSPEESAGLPAWQPRAG